MTASPHSVPLGKTNELRLETWESLAFRANFRPAVLAEHCGVSLRTVQRHFKTHYGITVSEWLRELRLKSAFDRLPSAASVKEVAFDLGYKQPSHFSRDFKSFYGLPPHTFIPPPFRYSEATQAASSSRMPGA